MWNRIKKMLSIITASTTGTLIACIFWGGITNLVNGNPPFQGQISFIMLPEILLIGVLTGIITELILPQKKDMGNREAMIRLVIHYVLITAVVLTCTYFYGWYAPTFGGVLCMCITIAAVYSFTAEMNYQAYKRTANEMNEKLKEFHAKKQEGTPYEKEK